MIENAALAFNSVQPFVD